MADSLPPGPVLERAVALAAELPGTVIGEILRRLGQVTVLDRRACAHLVDAAAQDSARLRITELLEMWIAEGHAAAPASLGWVLHTAHASDAWHRRRQRLELVWTGPVPHGTTLRRTDQALLDLVEGARRSVLLVTFAAYRVKSIHEALVAAADRGVRIDFVFETAEDSQGKMSGDPMAALGPLLAKRCHLWVWPAEKRARDKDGSAGLLHAKCALADEERLLVSSANFTGKALAYNMELGVLVEGGELPRTVAEHFGELMRDRVLLPMGT